MSYVTVDRLGSGHRFINPGSINIDRGHWPIMQPGDMGIRAKYIGDTQAHCETSQYGLGPWALAYFIVGVT